MCVAQQRKGGTVIEVSPFKHGFEGRVPADNRRGILLEELKKRTHTRNIITNDGVVQGTVVPRFRILETEISRALKQHLHYCMIASNKRCIQRPVVTAAPETEGVAKNLLLRQCDHEASHHVG